MLAGTPANSPSPSTKHKVRFLRILFVTHWRGLSLATHCRLDCLPTIISALGVLDDGAAPSGKHQQKGNIGIDIDFKKLHLRFDDVQKAHTAAIASGHRSRTAEGMEPDSEP